MGPSNSCGSWFVKFPNLFQPPSVLLSAMYPELPTVEVPLLEKKRKEKITLLSGVVLSWLNLGFLSNHPPSPRGNHIVGMQTVPLLLLFCFPFPLITTPGNPGLPEFFRRKGVSLSTHIHSKFSIILPLSSHPMGAQKYASACQLYGKLKVPRHSLLAGTGSLTFWFF